MERCASRLTMSRTVHIVGAGLAGLAAAVYLKTRKSNIHVRMYESSNRAGGRCYSFTDPHLGRQIDNGNHLLLSGNHATARYLELLGATHAWVEPTPAGFPFVDLRTGERWRIRPGLWPWWVTAIPGATVPDVLQLFRLGTAPSTATIYERMGQAGALYEKLIEPLAVSALNTSAHDGAATLLWRVLRETILKGNSFCRPLMARRGLTDGLVDPALTLMKKHRTPVHYGHRLRSIHTEDDRAVKLDFATTSPTLAREDCVILAVPPRVMTSLLPDVPTPHGHCPIINAHYVLPSPLPHSVVGLIGGMTQWIFVRHDIASVTVSAAEELIHHDKAVLARMLWKDVALALQIKDNDLPPCRVIKEKYATFRQTPDNELCRPGTATALKNVFLAGDWTDTRLPASIEGAIRSGFAAAQAI